MTNSHLPEFTGLSDLNSVPLDDLHSHLFEIAAATNAGSPAWQRRKGAETRDFLALSQLSGRLRVEMIDLSGPLRVLFALRVPVPTMPEPNGQLVVAGEALLGLYYGEESLRQPQPGYSFIRILFPNHVWLPNAAPSDPRFLKAGPGQPLCLGAKLPAGILTKELVLMSYGALSLQTVQLDVFDAAGLMNPPSATWWAHNRDRIPLTRESFLAETLS